MASPAALLSPLPYTLQPDVQNLQGNENFDISGSELVLGVELQSQLWPQKEQPSLERRAGNMGLWGHICWDGALSLASAAALPPREVGMVCSRSR